VCDDAPVEWLRAVFTVVVGLASLLGTAALPIVLVFRLTPRSGARSLMLALVSSPLTTLVLGVAIGVLRHGTAVQRGLYPDVFSERFVGAALVLCFVAWWTLGFRHLERRALGARSARR
jgi:hypothetical protein